MHDLPACTRGSLETAATDCYLSRLPPQTKDLAEGGAEGQAEQALKNMGAILKAAGADYKDVVKTTVLLADIADFGAVNTVYGELLLAAMCIDSSADKLQRILNRKSCSCPPSGCVPT